MKTARPSKSPRLAAMSAVVLSALAAIGITLTGMTGTNPREGNGQSNIHIIFGDEQGLLANSDVDACRPPDDLSENSHNTYCSYRSTPFDLFRSMGQSADADQPDLPAGLDHPMPRVEFDTSGDAGTFGDAAPDNWWRQRAIPIRSTTQPNRPKHRPGPGGMYIWPGRFFSGDFSIELAP
jgi:hypothetical protein